MELNKRIVFDITLSKIETNLLIDIINKGHYSNLSDEHKEDLLLFKHNIAYKPDGGSILEMTIENSKKLASALIYYKNQKGSFAPRSPILNKFLITLVEVYSK